MKEKDMLYSLIQEIKEKAVLVNEHQRSYPLLEYFGESKDELKQIIHDYDQLLKEWGEAVKAGKLINIEGLKDIFQKEIDQLKIDYAFIPSQTYRGISVMGLFYRFRRQLKYVEFEAALLDNNANPLTCNCRLRLTYEMEPVLEHLNHIGYGLDLYDEYKVYTCKHCAVNWIHYNAEVQVVVMKWKEWDKKEYPWKKERRAD